MSHRLVSFVLALCALAPLPAWAQQDPAALQRIRSQVQSEGRARVIVELGLAGGAHVPEGELGSAAAIAIQRLDIAAAGGHVISRIRGTGARIHHQYASVPMVAMDVDAAALAQLQAAGPYVARIMEDKIRYPVLYQSGPLVQADQASALGFDGTGWAIATIDTGVDKTHPFLAGRVVSEACFVNQLPAAHCPNGLASQVGSGAAVPFAGQSHGTHVAGIAAGNGPSAVPQPSPMMSGMARGASIIAIDVFGASDFTWDSDLIAGLSHVYSLRSTYTIASVNLSIGDGVRHTTFCDSDPLKPAIDNLRSVGIATVIAAGNDGFTNGVSGPACISTAVSVGVTTKNDVVWSISNAASYMSLWAPGVSIKSSVIGGGYEFWSGSSMATPHVTGAWAALKQANPTASVATILGMLQSAGTLITDTRSPGGVTRPRINIKDALLLSGPAPTSLNVTTGLLGQTLDVTITGTGFVVGTTVDFGAGITVNSTTLNSSTSLTVNITIATNATAGPRTVSVSNPGGGTAILANAFTIADSGSSAAGVGAGNPLSLAAYGVVLPYTTGGGTVALVEVASPVQGNANLRLVFFNAAGVRGGGVSLPEAANDVSFVDVGSFVAAGQNGLVAIAGVAGDGATLVPLASPIHARVYVFSAVDGRSRVLEPIILDTAEARDGPNTWSPLRSGGTFYAPLQTATVHTDLTLICPISTIQDATGTVPQQAFATARGFPAIVPGFPAVSSAGNLRVRVYDPAGQFLRDSVASCASLTELSVADIDAVYSDPSVAGYGTYTEIRVDPAKQNAFTGYRAVYTVGSPLNNFFGRLSDGNRLSIDGTLTTGAR